jgi:hypothetical protein
MWSADKERRKSWCPTCAAPKPRGVATAVTDGACRRIDYRCEMCGHVWHVTPAAREDPFSSMPAKLTQDAKSLSVHRKLGREIGETFVEIYNGVYSTIEGKK